MLYKKYKEGSNDSNIDYWLAGDIDVSSKTIDYKDCIAILQNIFKQELSKEDSETLITLGKMRNLMTHLGYWDDFGWYKIMIILNDTLTLINKFYYGNIHNSDRYIGNRLLQKTIDLKKYAAPHLNEQWLASNELALYAYYDYLDEMLKVNTTEYSLEIDESSLELKEITFERKAIISKLYIKVLPRKEAIVFINNNRICGITNVAELDWEYTNGESILKEKSFNIYYPKTEMNYDADMSFDWNTLGKCTTIEHTFNQLSKSIWI